MMILKKKDFISELKNAQRYIQGEIEREEAERHKLIAWVDTIQLMQEAKGR